MGELLSDRDGSSEALHVRSPSASVLYEHFGTSPTLRAVEGRLTT